MTSSIYKKDVILNATPITADTDILQENIEISREEVSPGGGALLRIAFSMTFQSANPTVSVYNGGVFVGAFETETGGNIVNDTIYNFRFVAEEPDNVNFRCDKNINSINIFRVHLLQNI